VCTFRIDQHDSSGDLTAEVPVEMRGSSVFGSLKDGDWVEVRASWRPGVTVQAQTVTNLSTNGVVRAPQHRLRRALGRFGACAFGLVVLGVLAAIAYVAYTSFQG
jgi:hypothetical protein